MGVVEVVVDGEMRASTSCWSCRRAYSYRLGTTLFSFCLFILAYGLYRSWQLTLCPVFLSAVRARRLVASSPSALRQALSTKK